MPAAAAASWNPARVEGFRNGAEGRCAGLPDFGDDRQDVVHRAIGFRLDRHNRCALRSPDIGIAELDALRLRRRKRRLRTPSDQGALFFGERSIKVIFNSYKPFFELRRQGSTRPRSI
jgi:hypothetical protein